MDEYKFQIIFQIYKKHSLFVNTSSFGQHKRARIYRVSVLLTVLYSVKQPIYSGVICQQIIPYTLAEHTIEHIFIYNMPPWSIINWQCARHYHKGIARRILHAARCLFCVLYYWLVCLCFYVCIYRFACIVSMGIKLEWITTRAHSVRPFAPPTIHLSQHCFYLHCTRNPSRTSMPCKHV